ncbi:MAG: AAA family ATPase [Chloroflexia bacterium]|nr:AAA family ATPase [Chloroflexia bacterium]
MSAGDRGGERAGHRLPIPLTRFVGREKELATLTGQLRDPAARLISVTGPGGVGKTRLVTQAALSLEPEFSGRIAIIRLDDITDPRDVLPTIARAIGADDGQRGPREALARFLGDDRWLLVLDNIEHLLPAASDVAGLLQHAAGTTVLVTSRARLQVAGEHVFPLAPLPVPPADRPMPIDLDRFAATRLFVDRAIAADPWFSAKDAEAAIAAICRRLDGLPLAIELAAARVAIMPPAALLEQLDAGSSALSVLRGGPHDAPDRLQSVEAAIAWSYDLLRPIERLFFRRMSVFVGGFTLSWAAAMIRGHNGGEAYPIDAGVNPRLH